MRGVEVDRTLVVQVSFGVVHRVMAHLPWDSQGAREIWKFGEEFVCRRVDLDGLYTREPCGCRLS